MSGDQPFANGNWRRIDGAGSSSPEQPFPVADQQPIDDRDRSRSADLEVVVEHGPSGGLSNDGPPTDADGPSIETVHRETSWTRTTESLEQVADQPPVEGTDMTSSTAAAADGAGGEDRDTNTGAVATNSDDPSVTLTAGDGSDVAAPGVDDQPATAAGAFDQDQDGAATVAGASDQTSARAAPDQAASRGDGTPDSTTDGAGGAKVAAPDRAKGRGAGKPSTADKSAAPGQKPYVPGVPGSGPTAPASPKPAVAKRPTTPPAATPSKWAKSDPAAKTSPGGANAGKVEAAKLAKDAVGDARRGLRDAEGVRDRARAGLDAAEKGARAAAAAKTGGASEKVLKTKPGQVALKVLRYALAANILLPFVLLLTLVLLTIAIIASYTQQAGLEGNIEYSLRSGHPMAVEDKYLRAYQNAAAEVDIPWTVLAGIGKVATDHGRSAPGDIAQYGAIVDRAPQRGALTSLGAGSDTPGKFAPPAGAQVVVVGDSLVGGGRTTLGELLQGYSVSFDFKNGASITSATPAVQGAYAQKASVVVIQAGVNDVYNGVPEEAYRTSVAALLDEGAAVDCVVWVNLQNFYAGSYDQLDGPAQRFNAVLAELAATRPWVTIADFAAVSSVAGLQEPDGLHPNAAGYRVWADTVMRSVLSCMRAPANVPAGAEDVASEATPSSSTTSPSPAPDPTSQTPSGRSSATTAPVSRSNALVDPRYSTYDCDNNVCGPYPQMGGDGRLPVGPLQIDPEFLKTYEGEGNPHDIDDAALMVAEVLADKRDDLLDSSLAGNYAGWRTDPDIAAELWAVLIGYAPVRLPVSLAAQATCATGPTAGPQGALLAWPAAAPTAVAEYGATYQGAQVAGMLLADANGSFDVLAAGSGSVADVGQDADGSFVLVAHGDGFTTRYGRLTSARVVIGATVASGAVLGSTSGPLLFQTLVSGSSRNPRLYVANASALPAAGADPQAGTPVTDPQAGTPVGDGFADANRGLAGPSGATGTADPQSGTPIDRCTGLVRAVGAGQAPQPGSSRQSTGRVVVPTGLVIPVAGVAPEQLSDTWGAARSGGRRHQGIDIVRPIGTPVLAAAPGTVRSNFSNGQPCRKPNAPPPRSISIAGSDGNFYYYGHMDQIFVTANQEVAAGELIGTVGETGNACHSAPHLHFSINENRPNVMNPYPLLVGGRSLSVDDFAGYLDATTLARLTNSALATGAAGQVVGYAWFYGGLVADDPNAGRTPGAPGGTAATITGGGVASGSALAGSNPEVAAIIRQYFPPAQWDNAIRLANCESRLNPGSVSRPNDDEYASRDWGLFQLNDHWVLPNYLPRTGEDPTNFERALDPHWNARVAAMIFEASGGWGQWTCAHHPTDRYPNLLGLVSMSPKMRDNGGRACTARCFDYGWDEPGPGDTSSSPPPSR